MTGIWKYDEEFERWYFYSDNHSAILDGAKRLLQFVVYSGDPYMYRRVGGTTMTEQEEQMAIEFGNNAGLFELSGNGIFEVAMEG